MRLTHFFIERPRFATVLSAFVTLLGLGALAILPVAQYPEIVPPTVQITTVYPGASADTVSRTEEFAPAFERALAAGKPALLHLKLDPQALTPNASLDDLRAQGMAGRRGS